MLLLIAQKIRVLIYSVVCYAERQASLEPETKITFRFQWKRLVYLDIQNILKWMFLPWKRDILWDSMIWQILFLSWQFVWVDELLFAVRAVSGFFINLPIFPQPPESPGILPAAGDHLLQEPTGGLQVQQGAQVQVRQEQADHRRGDDTCQQTHLGE